MDRIPQRLVILGLCIPVASRPIRSRLERGHVGSQESVVAFAITVHPVDARDVRGARVIDASVRGQWSQEVIDQAVLLVETAREPLTAPGQDLEPSLLLLDSF